MAPPAKKQKILGDAPETAATPEKKEVIQTAAGGASNSAKFDPSKHAGLLGISILQPEQVKKPTEFEIMTGAAPPPNAYIVALSRSVKWRLSKFLYNEPVTRLREPLHTMRTPDFVAKAAVNGQPRFPSGIMEPFDLDHCAACLAHNGIYEAAMTVWQFDLGLGTFDTIDLGLEGVSWTQYNACLNLWKKERLLSSSQDKDKERFLIEGLVSTAVQSVAMVRELRKKGGFFQGLPVCGGQAAIWALLGSLDAALTSYEQGSFLDESRELIIRLYEASINTKVRMRLAPKKAQIKLDELGYMDVIRSMNIATGACSFIEFANNILSLPEVGHKITAADLEKKLHQYGVTFHGNKINRHTCYCILSVVGLCDDGMGLEASRFLDRVDPRVLADPGRILSVMRLIKKNVWARGVA